MDEILSEVQAFLARTKLRPTRLGEAAVSDPNFYGDLLLGRQIRPETRDRLRAWMKSYEQDAVAALAADERRRALRAQERRQRRLIQARHRRAS